MKDLFQLALQGVKQKGKLTILMIANLVIGITLLLTMSTTVSLFGQSVLTDKASQMHHFSLNYLDNDFEFVNQFRYPPLTFQDAQALKSADLDYKHLSFNYDTRFILESEQLDSARPMFATASASDIDYFNVFNVPFIYGAPWLETQSQSDVIVIDKKVNDHFFSGENSVGQFIKINKQPLKIVGVMDLSKFKYRISNVRFNTRYIDLAIVPIATAERMNLPRVGYMPCQTKEENHIREYREDTIAALKSAECGYLQTWIEFDKQNHQQQLAAATLWARNYTQQQASLGRFPHKEKYKLNSLQLLLDKLLQLIRWEKVYLKFSYLLFAICLVNTVGILLAKYQSKNKLVSLYRALGASRWYIVKIHLIEISLIAFAAIIAGVLFAQLGLELMFQVSMYQMDYAADPSLVKHLFSMDYSFALTSGAFIYAAILIAGLYPVYRISGISPASQLRG
ncbi:ABC transporter permease [Pseudoalteromonas phenolica]|uniref:ABC transporter permease n=1 Tax=Pseudoalteromonas phenolica TaxID=161398 RepID=A0A4V2EK38_9GAMM|nr:ABC transporter permease [Pseudoalteromonas phenolica]RZQ54498.1 ABC transporter permease [Pseudoalteromonas phenolica]